MPPCVESIRYWGRPSWEGSQPMPAFWVMPKMSPLGRSSSISAVSGRLPCGPAPAVRISQTEGSDDTISPNAIVVFFAVTSPSLRAPQFGPRRFPFWPPGWLLPALLASCYREFKQLRRTTAGTGNAPPGAMLKKLGQRILDLIDTIPLGWLDPA